MRNYDPAPITAYGEVTNAANSNQLIAVQTDYHINIRRMTISIYEAAEGGGGLLRLQTTEGNIIYTMDADETKDFVVDGGAAGIQIPMDEGLDFIVYGAATKQASASIVVNAYKHRWTN